MRQKTRLFIVAVLCCFSCGHSDSDAFDSESVTDADMFLVSDDFKQYEQIVENDRRMVRNALKALTDEEKKRYFTLMKSTYPEMTDEVYYTIISEIRVLTGIDTDARIKRIHKARVNLISKITFPKKELLKAMQRQCLNMKALKLTRSSDEIDRSECLNRCSNVYSGVYSVCDPTGGSGPGAVSSEEDYRLWCQVRYCEMLAMEAYDECAMGCN